MTWIYLSPHYDDVIYSCGGLVWEQIQHGDRVEIWTVCGGKPTVFPLPPYAEVLHARWQTGPEAVDIRSQEDLTACALLGATPRQFDHPDCIYRFLPNGQPLVQAEEDLWQPLPAEDQGLITRLANELSDHLPENAVLVSPMTLGRHVDHRLTRSVVEAIQASRGTGELWYYHDYPYAVRPGAEEAIAQLTKSSWQRRDFPVSEAGLTAWQEAAAAYQSQLSSFWTDLPDQQQSLRSYWLAAGQAVQLWKAA